MLKRVHVPHGLLINRVHIALACAFAFAYAFALALAFARAPAFALPLPMPLHLLFPLPLPVPSIAFLLLCDATFASTCTSIHVGICECSGGGVTYLRHLRHLRYILTGPGHALRVLVQ